MMLLMPMAGQGQRFVEAGYQRSKPLIPIAGKALVQWALQSYQRTPASRVYLVRAQDHADLAPLLPDGVIITLASTTPGPLQTILAASVSLTDEELLIADCDSVIEAEELRHALTMFRTGQAAGGVTIRATRDAHCAFVALDQTWHVTEVREKDPFTSWSATGPYWWRSGQQFLRCARAAARHGVTAIAPVYNELLAAHGSVRAVPVNTFLHLGTPEDLQKFQVASVILHD